MFHASCIQKSFISTFLPVSNTWLLHIVVRNILRNNDGQQQPPHFENRSFDAFLMPHTHLLAQPQVVDVSLNLILCPISLSGTALFPISVCASITFLWLTFHFELSTLHTWKRQLWYSKQSKQMNWGNFPRQTHIEDWVLDSDSERPLSKRGFQFFPVLVMPNLANATIL